MYNYDLLILHTFTSQQPLPQELNAVAREIENLKRNVKEAAQQKKASPGLDNAKVYISYMSQVRKRIS